MPFEDELDDLENDAATLADTLARTGTLTRGFAEGLERTRGAMGGTVRDLGKLESGFSSGLRKAFDGLVLDGRSLSDTFRSLARSMADTAFNAAIRPVSDQVGGLLAQGVNGLVGQVLPFAAGGAFSQGRVTPFARGGVVGGPVAFPMHGGTGLMGEAGPEAIMPLARGADGTLGVRGGGTSQVNVTMNISTPDVAGFQKSRGQIAAELGRAVARGQRNR